MSDSRNLPSLHLSRHSQVHSNLEKKNIYSAAVFQNNSIITECKNAKEIKRSLKNMARNTSLSVKIQQKVTDNSKQAATTACVNIHGRHVPPVQAWPSIVSRSGMSISTAATAADTTTTTITGSNQQSYCANNQCLQWYQRGALTKKKVDAWHLPSQTKTFDAIVQKASSNKNKNLSAIT